MTRFGRGLSGTLVALALANSFTGCTEPEPAADAVILVTLDGLRWQDVFRGADTALMHEDHAADLRDRFWDPNPQTRRRKLMPFFWNVIVDQGTVIGDGDAGSTVRVTNDQLFSYPGYNEILTGRPDPRVDSNDKINNENVTVLEWIRQQDGFNSHVAAFASWDVFPYIINEERSGVPVDAGWYDTPDPNVSAPTLHLIDEISAGLPHIWPTVRFDALTVYAAVEYLRAQPTRVLYVALDETDTQAHEGRYDLYLDAMHRLDRDLSALWNAATNSPHYGERTTLIITSDHGRGRTVEDWTDHGVGPPGADETWMAVMGPYTPAHGVVENREVTLAQVAATLAAAVGLDYVTAQPEAAPAVEGVIVR